MPDSTFGGGTHLNSLSLAKITPPRVARVIDRSRLFELLESGRQKPVVWISAPAGSGKTTLMSSYLAFSKRLSLWLQMDEGDGDSPSFFYHLGLAAQKAVPRRNPLPLLTPEYSQSRTIFAIRYFEKLFSRLSMSSMVVFDNYQDASGDSEIHDLIARGLGTIPEGIQVVVISRKEPPRQFSRLKAHEMVHSLAWNELRFSLEECDALLRLRGVSLQDGALRSIYEKTDGWAAGIILCLERLKSEKRGSIVADFSTPEEVFDYFAAELFDGAPGELQEFLLRTAFLPRMTPHNAGELSGSAGAGKILSSLCRNNHFTARHAGKAPEYQYHPLLRDFLLGRANEVFTPAALARLKRHSADLLLESGSIAEAAALYISAGAWEPLAALVVESAPDFMAKGRSGILEGWIDRIPEDIRQCYPWLLYWKGLCRLAEDPLGSRVLLEEALALFEWEGNDAGAIAAWTKIVESIVLEWSDCRLLDQWISWLDKRLAEGLQFSSKEMEAEAVLGMVYALTHRDLGHPAIGEWVRRALDLAEESPDPGRRIRALLYTSQYYTFMGDRAHILIVLEKMKNLAHILRDAPLLSIQYSFMVAATHCWTDISPEVVLGAVSEGLASAGKYGIHLFDHLLLQFGVYVSLQEGNLPLAGDFLDRMAVSIHMHRQAQCQYDHLSAWYHALRGDFPRALAHAEHSLRVTLGNGMFYSEVISHHLMAQILIKQEKHAEAREHLYRLGEMAGRSGSPFFLFTFFIAEAQLALEQGRSEELSRFLRAALEMGRTNDLFSVFWWWDPKDMSRLCEIALEDGIEEDFTRRLIRRRRLSPPPSAQLSDLWSFPVKIQSFADFSISRDDRPITFPRKSDNRAMTMLKALIASGEGGMGHDRLIDILWPDAEGDKAHKSFKFTLHQLREVIGGEAVLLQGGMVKLNPGVCWIDLRAFEKLCAIAESLWNSDIDRASRAATRALSLYRGDFLSSLEYVPEIVEARERTRARFREMVGRLGKHLEEAGLWKEAEACYRRGIGALVSISGECPNPDRPKTLPECHETPPESPETQPDTCRRLRALIKARQRDILTASR